MSCPCFAAGVALITLFSGLPGLAQSLPLSDSEFEPAAPPPELNGGDRPLTPAAVEPRSLQPLTLDQAVELAEQNNRLLQIARLQVEVLKTIQQEAESTLLPRLVLGANLTYERLPVGEFVERQVGNALGELRNTVDQRVESLVPPEFRPLAEREINLLNSFADRALANIINRAGLGSIGRSSNLPLSATAAVVYEPDIWGARSALIQSAAMEVQSSELEVQRQSEDLRLLVTLEYYNLQETDALVHISEVALANAQSVLADARALQAGGVGSQLDVRRAQVLVANIQQGLETALTLQKNSRRRLVQRLGLPIAVDVTAADPVAIAGIWPLSLDESIVAAHQNRLELDQLRLQQQVNQRQERLVRSGNRPQLSLFASYSVLNVLNAPFNPGFVDGSAVGGTLLWELYDGGATSARVARTQVNQEILANQLAEAESEIWLQVEESYNDLQANSSNIETAAANVAEAQEVLRQSRLGFNAGVTTQLEVTTAQTNLTDAETNRVRSILNYNRALAALQRSVNLPGS